MSDTPEKCPHCEAMQTWTDGYDIALYSCGSTVGPRAIQTEYCALQSLTADRDRWRRLAEELADAGHEYNHAPSIDSFTKFLAAIAAVRAAGKQ